MFVFGVRRFGPVGYILKGYKDSAWGFNPRTVQPPPPTLKGRQINRAHPVRYLVTAKSLSTAPSGRAAFYRLTRG